MDDQTFLYEHFLQKLDEIQENARPEWGIMTPHHMIEHLSMLFVISNGKFQAPSFLPEEKQARRKHGFFERQLPFPKNFSPLGEPKLEKLRFENINAAKQKLKAALERYQQYHQENPEVRCNHPVMGPLNHQEWNEFHARHIQHHLEQFGIKP